MNNSNDDYPKLLYVTPEKLVRDHRVIDMCRYLKVKNKLERFVIDEVHCVS